MIARNAHHQTIGTLKVTEPVPAKMDLLINLTRNNAHGAITAVKHVSELSLITV